MKLNYNNESIKFELLKPAIAAFFHEFFHQQYTCFANATHPLALQIFHVDPIKSESWKASGSILFYGTEMNHQQEICVTPGIPQTHKHLVANFLLKRVCMEAL